MPVRLLTSSVFKWPDKETVDAAVRGWVEKVAKERPEVVRIGYFGSYARGDWGVGSDLDLIIILESSDKPFEIRAVEWDTAEIPVSTDTLVYTQKEWFDLNQSEIPIPSFVHEIIWVYISH